MPRRTADTGPDKEAGIQDGIRIRYRDGAALLASKNEADNARFDEFDSKGNLEGWVLDNPPEEYGFGVYVQGPGFPTPTRQGTITFEDPSYDQRGPLVDGDPPPDQAHRAQVGTFALPPVVELVATGFLGFAAGWWAVTDAFGIGPVGGGKITPVAPLVALEVSQGQKIRVPMRDSVPEGVTYITIGANGPFPNEAAALNTATIYRQLDVPTHPRWPAVLDLEKFFNKQLLSFDKNTTVAGRGKKAKKKKKKPPGGKTVKTTTGGEEDDD